MLCPQRPTCQRFAVFRFHILPRCAVQGLHVQLLEASTPCPGAIRRTLRVTRPANGASHTLQHYHYHTWPDHGTPKETEGIRALCHALDAVRRVPSSSLFEYAVATLLCVKLINGFCAQVPRHGIREGTLNCC